MLANHPRCAVGVTMPHTQTIRCVKKSDSRLAYLRILSVGGTNSDGSRWTQSQEKTIKEIESGQWEFFAQGVWRRDRIVVSTYLGYKYLKAVDDVSHPDTLLSLPECP
jgi:hypothetical protein